MPPSVFSQNFPINFFPVDLSRPRIPEQINDNAASWKGCSHAGWTMHRALQRLLPQNTTLRDTLFAAPVTEGHVSQWHGLAVFQWAVSWQRNLMTG